MKDEYKPIWQESDHMRALETIRRYPGLVGIDRKDIEWAQIDFPYYNQSAIIGASLSFDESSTYTGQDNIFLRNGLGTQADDNFGASIGFSILGSSGNERRAAIVAKQKFTDADHVGLSFYVHDNSNPSIDLLEAIEIDSLGNFRILSGDYLVGGPGQDKCAFRAATATNVCLEFRVSDLKLAFTDNLGDDSLTVHATTGEVEVVQNDLLITVGDVGIGTSFQNAKLDIITDANPVLETAIVLENPTATNDATAVGIDFVASSGRQRKGMIAFERTVGQGAGRFVFGLAPPGASSVNMSHSKVTILNNGYVGVGSDLPAFPLTVVGNQSDGSNIVSVWADSNFSGTGYITRTSVFDKSKKSRDYIKDSDYYVDDGKINHSKFYGYVAYPVTDFDRPVIVLENETYINESDNSTVTIFYNQTTYPHIRIEEGVELGAEINVLRQETYELRLEINELKELLNVTYDVEIPVYACSYRGDENCPGGFNNPNKEGLRTWCYNPYKLGWKTCSTGWVII